jgi:hypothetical protein
VDCTGVADPEDLDVPPTQPARRGIFPA